MKIGYLFAGYEKNIAGINRVILETIRELQSQFPEHEYYAYGDNYMNLPLKELNSYKNIKTKENVDFVLNKLGKEKDMDIIHSFYNPIDKITTSQKKIFTIHDLAPLNNPKWFPDITYTEFMTDKRVSAEMADIVVADSEYTKSDIISYYGIESSKIEVVYNGIYTDMDINNADNEILEKLKVNGKYILSVGTLEPRKNLRGLISAFINYKKKTKSKVKLVIAGRMGWDSEFDDFMQKQGSYKDDIIISGYVSNSELSALYKFAEAFCYVSFFEGFGLPILEAMAAGKAVICSNTSSMPEVGGDAVEYCDPYDENTILEALERVLEDDERRKKLEKLSIPQSKKFSYNNAAIQINDIYDKLLLN